MTAKPGPPPGPIRRFLRLLLPGARGAEVVEELDREHARLRARRSPRVAAGWYLTQAFRPSTWHLAWALRRTWRFEREARRGRLPTPGRTTSLGGMLLDVKLAGRMLLKSPGLTVVGVLGIALGVAISAGAFVVLSATLHPELPLDEGERIVALQHWDVRLNHAVPVSLHDYLRWKEEVRSVAPLAAATRGTRALVTGDALPDDVRWAAMSATAFDVARVPPTPRSFAASPAGTPSPTP